MFSELVSGRKIAFHQIYKPSGEHVRLQLVANEVVECKATQLNRFVTYTDITSSQSRQAQCERRSTAI